MNKSVWTYAFVGGLLAFLIAGRRRGGKVSRALKGAALGAGVAFVAPRVGVNLPGLPATSSVPAAK